MTDPKETLRVLLLEKDELVKRNPSLAEQYERFLRDFTRYEDRFLKPRREQVRRVASKRGKEL